MNAGKDTLKLQRGELSLPVFLPDATFGAVRSIDSLDLVRCGIQGLVMNTFHLMQRPGSSTVRALGGLHKMAHWNAPIVTDSGGFQAYSLIRENSRYGSINRDGITFVPETGRKFNLTPEKTIQLQLSYGTDIAICLDDCTHPDDHLDIQRESVDRTIKWAHRCKETFARLVAEKELPPEERPLIFGVIQGGHSRDLRRRCADELLAIGFDGYGFGGWPLDHQRNLLTEIIGYTRELVPSELPMHALGLGHPANIVEGHKLGYQLFDSALPTRDARQGRLYAFVEDVLSFPETGLAEAFSYLYVGDKKHIKAAAPIFSFCDCETCAQYSVGYLHHLFAVKDASYQRLATIHNLRFMTRLMESLRISRLKTVAVN